MRALHLELFTKPSFALDMALLILHLADTPVPTTTMNYPIKGFLETSFSDWPGKMAAVLFLPSCNFRCPFCHNHELVLRPEQFPDYPVEEVVETLRRRKGWVDGVCLTGGEPTLHPWLPALIRDLKSALRSSGMNLEIKLDTNGTNPECLQTLIDGGLVDYVAMDLKGPLETSRYGALAGVPIEERELARIQASIQTLLLGKVDYEFRTTVVPSLMEEEEIYALANRLRQARRYTLQNFNPRAPLEPRLRQEAPWDDGVLRRVQDRVNEIIRS
jgi:pyruvate formate lyase activating enzyme